MANFEQDVDVLAVFKEVHKLSHICVLHRAMDLDLAHQLLLGSAALEGRLLNDLGSRDGLGVALHKFIALREPTLTKEFTFDILTVGDLSVRMLNSLLDDLGTLILGRMQVGLAAGVLTGGKLASAGASALGLGPDSHLAMHVVSIEVRHFKN